MTTAWRWAGVLLLPWFAGCATPEVQPNAPVQVTKTRVGPWESHELCAQGVRGDRIDFRYDATEPVAFSIGYRDSGATILPLTRAAATSDSGIFPVRDPQRYCLTWQAGGAGALLDYRVIVHRALP